MRVSGTVFGGNGFECADDTAAGPLEQPSD